MRNETDAGPWESFHEVTDQHGHTEEWYDDNNICWHCQGTGVETVAAPAFPGGTDVEICSHCRGTGKFNWA